MLVLSFKTCTFHFKCLSIIMPRYFIESSSFIIRLFVSILSKSGRFEGVMEKAIYLVLSTFSESLKESSQFWILLKPDSDESLTSDQVCPEKNRYRIICIRNQTTVFNRYVR